MASIFGDLTVPGVNLPAVGQAATGMIAPLATYQTNREERKERTNLLQLQMDRAEANRKEDMKIKITQAAIEYASKANTPEEANQVLTGILGAFPDAGIDPKTLVNSIPLLKNEWKPRTKAEALEFENAKVGLKEKSFEKEAYAEWKTENPSGTMTDFLKFKKSETTVHIPDFQEKAYEEWLSNNPGGTRMGFLKEKQSIGTGGFDTLSQEEKEVHFDNYILSGKIPTMAMRDADSRNAFNRGVAQYVISKGKSGVDIATNRKEFDSLSKSLNNQQKIVDMMEGFSRNLNKQVDRVETISKDVVDRVGVRALDLPIREWKTKFVGSGNEQVLSSYLLEISNEIGKLSTGSSASIAELSVEAQKRWNKVHDPNLSFKELMKVLDATREQANMRVTSSKEVIGQTKEAMKTVTGNKKSDEKILDAATAKSFLDKAGGDKVKARQMAKDEGYQF